MSIKARVLSLAFTGLVVWGCSMNAENEEKFENVKYFSTFSGYNIPLRLSGEVSKEVALKKEAYYIGFYDEAHRLFRVEKYLRGELFFRQNYFYREDGSLEECHGVNHEGVEVTNRFDETGQQI